MNIFVLDLNVVCCAQYHCDQHVSEMILESVQIMCTALHANGFATPYRPTHAHHPCVRWAGASFDNFLWLGNLAESLNTEYRYRYKKQDDHASIKVLEQIRNLEFEGKGRTPFAQAMPDQYKNPYDPVAAYRAFYMGEKQKFATWTRRARPEWWRSPE